MKNQKKWIVNMSWGELPIWFYSLVTGTFFSWLLMWPAKIYVGKWLVVVFFSLWAIGTFSIFIVGLFFPYQYPRNRKK